MAFHNLTGTPLITSPACLLCVPSWSAIVHFEYSSAWFFFDVMWSSGHVDAIQGPDAIVKKITPTLDHRDRELLPFHFSGKFYRFLAA